MQFVQHNSGSKHLEECAKLSFCFDYQCSCLCGWITSGWEAHSSYYRHCVSVLSAPWFDYPFSLTRHELTWAKVHSLAKWIAASGDWTVTACIAVADNIHYTIMSFLYFGSIYNKFYFYFRHGTNRNISWPQQRSQSDQKYLEAQSQQKQRSKYTEVTWSDIEYS